MNFKYIIIKEDNMEKFILFNYSIGHNIIGKNLDVVSAGFCEIKNEKVRCYGESKSLGIGSRKKDSEIISTLIEIDEYISKVI